MNSSTHYDLAAIYFLFTIEIVRKTNDEVWREDSKLVFGINNGCTKKAKTKFEISRN